MGLDITAYTELTLALGVAVEDGRAMEENCWHADEMIIKRTEEHWPGRTDGLKPGSTYRCAETFDFEAGSYSGYNQWRDRLAQLAGYPSAQYVWDNEIATGPFVEQIHFADNQGVIGPVIAAKLARDYQEHREQADASAAEDGGWFVARYRDWMQAFEMAANGGAIEFH